MKLRIRAITLSLILIPVLILTSGFQGIHTPIHQDQDANTLDQFDLLTETDGWIRMGNRIFWTHTAGQDWVELTLPILSQDSVLDVFFLNKNSGWILSRVLRGGELQYSLAHTTDRGSTWDVQTLALFDSGEISDHAENAYMGWLDSKTGWIAFKQPGSANFSVGTLFITTDAGQSWRKRFLPLADNVNFNTPLKGWASGGPDGKQIQRTQDGGQSWENIRPQVVPLNAHIHPPVFIQDKGMLFAADVETGHVFVYRTRDFGSSWEIVQDLDLGIRSNGIGLSFSEGMLAVQFPAKSLLMHVDAEKVFLTENSDGQAESIIELNMTTSKTGWGKSHTGNCDSENICVSVTRLLNTNNGGKTWAALTLPHVESQGITRIFENTRVDSLGRNALTGSEIAPVMIGQGFDACEIPTSEELNVWKTSSPYDAVNLYIGGSARACSNTALSSAYLAELGQQGWKFIPTWVGPQAPCTRYISKMSADPATAFTQGVAEAKAAVSTLHNLGLTYPDKSGSVVYYDIEYYGTNTDCRAAVNSFMNGWVSQLRALGTIAGVYGSTLCDTGLSDFRDITHVPDVIWPARWYHNPGEGSYDPNATVWDLGSCLPNTIWNDHQRIRQYEGSHDETWGEVILNIDNNVLDGIVAIPFTNPYVLSSKRMEPSPTSLQSVTYKVKFSEPVTGVDLSDFNLTVSGLTGTAVTNVIDTGNQANYLVTVLTGQGNGTIRLNVNNSGTGIQDLDGEPLYGGFTTGRNYTVNKRLQFYSQPRFDGWVLESGESSRVGGTKNKKSKYLKVGDDSDDRQFRAILSFATSAIPDNAVITAATLQVKPAGETGGNPLGTHDRLVLDIIRDKFDTLPALQVEDFQARPDNFKIARFSKKLYAGWYRAVLFQRAYPFINVSGRTQFRLRFTLDDDDDNSADILKLYSGNAVLDDSPLLIIDYYTPGNDPLLLETSRKHQSLGEDLEVGCVSRNLTVVYCE
jgi:photosystem II stability/assembly factor-like uncharacterized protein